MWFLRPTFGSRDGKISPGDTFQASNYDSDDKNNYDAKLNLLDTIKDPLRIDVSIGSDNKKTLKEIKQEMISRIGVVSYGPTTIREVSDFILNSEQAIEVSYNNPGVYSIVLLNDKNYEFDIALYSRDITESSKRLFTQILSTFKFLD
ncbi:hypothetical protein COT65_01590 [Candidatus Shapirobacteria bacterium CG09_land_8_20_14_0_10_47_13]|uniref:Uncharacterized protein n=1 Tax=Candidatus Shapirobacteria bacterium CG09_land_8_20_14_0_10_47_13 TaxID=1974481 RepID=A0A2H0WMS7_9BACT|nr:MAG: hypothetical protein COT65_01590 [Candidatus Shapirobacteria bacterium CG09_land_8_20_14_0_10_47_13]